MTPVKIPVAEVYSVRSYMFDVETRETMWLDRIDRDIVMVLEKLAAETPAVASVSISDDLIVLKLKSWKVGISRDAVVIKSGDYALIADTKFFLLLRMDKDGYYVPVAKSETVTWDGTEEYFTPSDVRRLVKETLRSVFERAQWL
jgi:hypothetical protein